MLEIQIEIIWGSKVRHNPAIMVPLRSRGKISMELGTSICLGMSNYKQIIVPFLRIWMSVGSTGKHATTRECVVNKQYSDY